ncbi:MAG: type II toxin-antitoxin system VapC family toxin [Bryobacteraceae bacterium]|jgi:predicted nucleic acid-binding protein
MIAAAVVAASVAVKWVVEEPGSGQARMLARARLEAPDLLAVECANILWKKARIGDIDARQARERLDALLEAPVALTPSRDLLGGALGLALDLEHPVYDCLYLALALARGVPLVTADERLAKAVRKRKSAVRVTLLSELS